MAPRLKILVSSVSKKGTKIYFPFLSKVLVSESPPGSRWGPYGERCLLTGHFTYLFISKSLRIGVPPCSPKVGPLQKQMPIPELQPNISFGVPSKGAVPPGPPHWVPSKRGAPFLEPSFIHHSKSPVYEPPSWLQVPLGCKGASMERDAHIRSLF